ncbi:MAG: molybdopterin molybdenumtransferase MoeA [Candidatus Thiodiazotropha sp. (ex Monitilora ramsayi)]|nr:molybdopterin molybdenumtransferase MoeA [Candidatus Thiodiazotropha sp. (ex Monitilora ramsayi)]
MNQKVFNTLTSCADPESPETLSVTEARERILKCISPIEATERLAIRDGLGRVLGEDIVSPMDVPGHTNSAMDGFALSAADLPEDYVNLKVIGTIYAGDSFQGVCRSGECVRIMTGAPMPAGTDTVIMQEQTMAVESDHIRIGNGHRAGQNVRQAGEDIAKGSVVLEAGRRLLPADLGILASLGFGEINVRQRPKVAFFSTGDELRSVGEPLLPGELYDSNRYTLYGMLIRAGVEILDLGVIKDDPDALRQAFTQAASVSDVVLSSGGVSVGEADYTKSILQSLGKMQFWKIAMKPGRPLTFGHLHDALFFGLPGNPVAVMVTFYQFVLPALHVLSTGKRYEPFTLRARSENIIRKRSGRFEFVRGTMQQTPDGDYSVVSLGRQGSGILTSMSHGNCFILLEASCDGVEPGEYVTIQPFISLV